MNIEITKQQLEALKHFLVRVQQMLMPTEVSSYIEIINILNKEQINGTTPHSRPDEPSLQGKT